MPTLHHLILLLFFSLSTATTTTQTPPHFILSACHVTLYPLQCQTTLHSLSSTLNPTPQKLIKTTLTQSLNHLKTSLTLISKILSTFPNSHNLTYTSLTCLDHLSASSYRTHHSSISLSRASFLTSRAYASAALTYQYDCFNELSYVNTTRVVHTAMNFLNSTLMVTTSNAVSLLHALVNYGEDVATWAGPPKTERDGFWEKTILSSSKGLRFEGGVEENGKVVNVVVCKGGKARGCHESVQEAVDSAPAWLKGKGRFVILIKEGVYEEIVRVPLEKRNLVFLGDGIGKTVITGSVNTGVMGITTYNTATVGKYSTFMLCFGL